MLLLAVALPVAGRAADDGPVFEDVAGAAGLSFVHFNGMDGALYAAEHMGGAVALIDVDGDGDLDVYLGQGGMIDDQPIGKALVAPAYPLPLTDRLYRNDLEVVGGEPRLRFVDATVAAGLEGTTGYTLGVASGDYDRDGRVDLYVTNLGTNDLLHNEGGGRFRRVTEEAGADDRRFSVPASFFDFDGDGWLDLYVGNYNDFRLATHKTCYLPQGALDYCGPLAYAPEPGRLLHNRGDGTFEDISVSSGIAALPGTALGSIAADFDGDGKVDLYVANDMLANRLWINRGGGHFADEALLRGAALDGEGRPQASMGVVAGDLDGDGDLDLFMTHLLRERNTLYRNDGTGMYVDDSLRSGLGDPSWLSTGFGVGVLDFDGDGSDDLYVANGAVFRIAEQVRAGDPLPLRQPNQLFRGRGDGTFDEVPSELRERPVLTEVSRGVAVGDLDNDGDPDLVVTNNAGPVRLLLNRRRPAPERWVGLRLLDERGAVDVFGAMAHVAGSGHWQRVHTDGSYASASDPRLLFALPTGVATVEAVVRWPDGRTERFGNLERGRYHTLKRGGGAPEAREAGR